MRLNWMATGHGRDVVAQRPAIGGQVYVFGCRLLAPVDEGHPGRAVDERREARNGLLLQVKDHHMEMPLVGFHIVVGLVQAADAYLGDVVAGEVVGRLGEGGGGEQQQEKEQQEEEALHLTVPGP